MSRSRVVLEFFQPLPTDVKNPADCISKEKKIVTKNVMDISAPSKLPTYRCVDDFTAVEKTELSLKRNALVQVIQRHFNGLSCYSSFYSNNQIEIYCKVGGLFNMAIELDSYPVHS